MNWIGREEIITSTTDWVVPEARNQLFQVTVWGAGGSGSCDGNYTNQVSGAGGGAGEMSFGEFTINQHERIHVEIGQGGKGLSDSDSAADFGSYIVGRSGGATSFGNMLMASGGCGGNRDIGGIGGHNGGNSGETAEGNYIGYGVVKDVDGIQVRSGGGAGAVNARGVGGTADRCGGNGGTAAGGAGAFAYKYGNSISRRIGSGGPGVCVIRYYAPIG